MDALSSSDEEDRQFSQESDSYDLPDIRFSKASPLLLCDDRPVTPPVVPALLSVPTLQSTEIASLTSLEHLSPLKVAGVAQKLKADAKLLQKANDLSNDIICKEEMDRKVKGHTFNTWGVVTLSPITDRSHQARRWHSEHG